MQTVIGAAHYVLFTDAAGWPIWHCCVFNFLPMCCKLVTFPAIICRVKRAVHHATVTAAQSLEQSNCSVVQPVIQAARLLILQAACLATTVLHSAVSYLTATSCDANTLQLAM
jgi:hypothetical protein